MVVYIMQFLGLALQHMDDRLLRENIYKRRKELGLSQECVAEQVDISLNAYIKIEKGPTKIFNPKIVKIAEALDITPEALILGSVITMEKHTEACENLKQYYHSRIGEYKAAIESKDLFVKRLNEMIEDKNAIIARLEKELLRVESELERLKKE